jgi:hypothetical protein
MFLEIGKEKKIIDKIFVDKNIHNMPINKKMNLWINDLKFYDYSFFEKINENQNFTKINLLFVSDRFKKKKSKLLLYNECYINILEKDRCIIKFKNVYNIHWSQYKNYLEPFVVSEQRKEKIINLLHEN